MWLLAVLLVVPVVALLVAVVALRLTACSSPSLRRLLHRRALTMARPQLSVVAAVLVMAEALLLALLVTEFLKLFVGRKRPSFFAMCDYQGYRSALAQDNFTAYLALTAPGRPGNLTLCRETDQVRLSVSLLCAHAAVMSPWLLV